MKPLYLLLLAGLAACSTTPDTTAPAGATTPPRVAATGATVDEIKRLIGTPTCSDNAQCRSLPVGALACGGPQAYLPFSTAKSSTTELTALAERSKTEREAEIKTSGEMSICINRPDPGAVCVAGTCQLGVPQSAN